MFNITDFLIWQMATTYSLNGDTGAHNMYLHGPTAGVEQSDPNRLWRVVNSDAFSLCRTFRLANPAKHHYSDKHRRGLGLGLQLVWDARPPRLAVDLILLLRRDENV